MREVPPPPTLQRQWQRQRTMQVALNMRQIRIKPTPPPTIQTTNKPIIRQPLSVPLANKQIPAMRITERQRQSPPTMSPTHLAQCNNPQDGARYNHRGQHRSTVVNITKGLVATRAVAPIVNTIATNICKRGNLPIYDHGLPRWKYIRFSPSPISLGSSGCYR